jgi:hypothetical protein
MNERPILFSAEMVAAILDGRKTQTRRIMKPQPEHGVMSCPYTRSGWSEMHTPDGTCKCQNTIKMPYGDIGNRLWVRETWRYYDDIYSASYDTETAKTLGYPPYYLKNGKRLSVEFRQQYPKWRTKWRPSIFMPRTASRILLEITDVTVERLQDITLENILAEGVPPIGCDEDGSEMYEAFANLWNGINGADSWQSNPFVWVIQFQTIQIKT